MEKNNNKSISENVQNETGRAPADRSRNQVSGDLKGPTNTHKSCKKRTSTILLGLLIIVIFIAGYLVYQNFQLKKLYFQSNEMVNRENQLPSPQYFNTETDFETYTDRKLGFMISYPSSLSPTEIDVRADQRQYNLDCETGTIDGCGGSRWPDYEIDFLDSRLNTVFSIKIHVVPVSEFLVDAPSSNVEFGGMSPASKSSSNFGLYYGVVKDGFSYIFEGTPSDSFSIDYLDSIASTFKFIESERPLGCLWFDEFVGVDLMSIGGSSSNYASFSGYFYNDETNNCQETEVYVWNSEDSAPEESANVPFQSMSDCISSCVE